MAKRPVDFEEVQQLVKDNRIKEVLEFVPDDVLEFAVSNLIQRTFAHVYGRGKSGAIPIEATEAGELKVASVGSGLEDYDYQSHTAASDAAIAYTFAAVISSIDMIVETQDALVRFSPDGTRWGGWFLVKKSETYYKDIVITKMEIKNSGAGLNHLARIWGYY